MSSPFQRAAAVKFAASSFLLEELFNDSAVSAGIRIPAGCRASLYVQSALLMRTVILRSADKNIMYRHLANHTIFTGQPCQPIARKMGGTFVVFICFGQLRISVAQGMTAKFNRQSLDNEWPNFTFLFYYLCSGRKRQLQHTSSGTGSWGTPRVRSADHRCRARV